MERLCQENEINWITLTIYGASFLKVLMEDYGYAFEDGMILVTDSEMDARRFVSGYCHKIDANGVQISKMSKKDIMLEDYQCGFLIYKKGMKEENMATFLFEQQFFPILVAGGILPDYLREDRYIFRIRKEDLEAVYSKQVKSKIAEFYLFLINNVEEVCMILSNLNTSILVTEYCGRESEKNIFSIFAGIGKIFAAFLRQTYSERKAIDFLNMYIQETKERLQQMKDFSSGEELTVTISYLVWEFLDNHKEIFVSNIREINELVYQALRDNSAILYDEDFYFFPPSLLMEICEPLLQTASEPELKRRLREDGIIHCNSADYTIKKNLYNVYGARECKRMIWVHKEHLYSAENLCLEDQFDLLEHEYAGNQKYQEV